MDKCEENKSFDYPTQGNGKYITQKDIQMQYEKEKQMMEMMEIKQRMKMNEDPWKHRNDGMKCKTCMWFVPKKVKDGITQDSESSIFHLGRCRRHAPTMNGYPVVFVNDWCGDHKLDENKI